MGGAPRTTPRSGTAESSAWVYGCCGRAVQRVAVTDLGDPTQVHHRHPVAEVPHHAQVVGDEDERDAELLAQVLEQVHHLRLDRHVEGADRLVGDDHLGLYGQRAGDADALALAAGELVRVAVVVLGVEPDHLQQLLDPVQLLALGHDVVHPQGACR